MSAHDLVAGMLALATAIAPAAMAPAVMANAASSDPPDRIRR